MGYRHWLTAAAMVVAQAGTARAQAGHVHAGMHAAGDSAFKAMQARGKTAMGVDQERSTHGFTALPDGGRIVLTSDIEDTAATGAIRRHFADIQKAFSEGDFNLPAMVHDQVVPGTDAMRKLAGTITYVARDVPRGAELRISSRDPAAITAIHRFLAFQRAEHHAGQ